MPELESVQTQKTAGFVDRGYNYQKKRLRMEEEEKEIARLEAIQKGEEVPDEAEEEVEEVQATEQVNPPVEEEESEENLSAEEKSFKKRYGDLRRHMQEKENEWKEKFEALEARMQNKNIVPPKSDEDIEKWAKKYPDVAGIVETIAAKKAQELFKKAESRFQELDKVTYEATRTKAENQIRQAHADFDEIRESDKFHEWAEQQPKWVQDAVYENADDAASVIRVIDLYKVDNNMTPAAKKSTAKKAASMVSRNNKASIDPDESSSYVKESDVARMSAHEFEQNADKINQAIRSGKFVYDISGKAR